MRIIQTEFVASMSSPSEVGFGTVFDANAVTVRIEDEAAGPFLVVCGRMDDEDKPGSFVLESAADIDQFAAACRALLAQAQ